MKVAARFDSLPPYQPIVPFDVLSAELNIPESEILKMDANENPYGISPKTRQALAELPYAHIYPDPESRALRAALSGYTGVAPENLLAGAGADELIDLLLRVLLDPGDKVIICPPTFGMYSFDILLNAGQVIEVPRKADFSLDIEGIRAAVSQQQPAAIFIANPDNPAGVLTPQDEIQKLLELPLLIVLDEAYIEFTGNGGRLGETLSWIQKVPERQNLVVLRTFSKWAGLAGLRVGYGAFPAWLLPALWKAKQPYNVNVAASAAAIASLEDLDWLAENVARLRAERSVLFDRLQAVPYLDPVHSQSNFILCRVNGRSAAEIKDALARQGIAIRYYDTPKLSNYIRISVGTPAGTERLADALQALADGREIAPRITAISPASAGKELPQPRTAFVQRETRETKVAVRLKLDGTGKHTIASGLGFFDHMLAQLAVHGHFDLDIDAVGDLHVDPHHTVEDTALALGEAFDTALGQRTGIARMGSALVPMDDSLAEVVIDLSGRPYAVIRAEWHAPATGGIPNSLWAHFIESFARRARCNVFVTLRCGNDDHHQIEAIFKALGRALDMATRIEPRSSGQTLSSKGTLTA